jgi:hypothetical protein
MNMVIQNKYSNFVMNKTMNELKRIKK